MFYSIIYLFLLCNNALSTMLIINKKQQKTEKGQRNRIFALHDGRDRSLDSARPRECRTSTSLRNRVRVRHDPIASARQRPRHALATAPPCDRSTGSRRPASTSASDTGRPWMTTRIHPRQSAQWCVGFFTLSRTSRASYSCT